MYYALYSSSPCLSYDISTMTASSASLLNPATPSSGEVWITPSWRRWQSVRHQTLPPKHWVAVLTKLSCCDHHQHGLSRILGYCHEMVLYMAEEVRAANWQSIARRTEDIIHSDFTTSLNIMTGYYGALGDIRDSMEQRVNFIVQITTN